MVVVNPDDIIGLDQRGGGIGEQNVDPFINFSRLTIIFSQINAIVKQQP